jgi:hypothetical protein
MSDKPSGAESSQAASTNADSPWNPGGWIANSADVVKLSIQNAPKRQVALLAFSFLAAVIAIGGGTFFIEKGQYLFGLLLYLVVIICLAYFGILCMSVGRQPRSANTMLWSRIVIKDPHSPLLRTKMAKPLSEISKAAQRQYKQLLEKRKRRPARIDVKKVRVNVFLPDTSGIGYGEVCGLFIPDGFSLGMDDDLEREITFRPNEGVTGSVFTLQEPVGTNRGSATGEWNWLDLKNKNRVPDVKFQLTQIQMNLIDPGLRWIISFPLVLEGRGKSNTFGVLNVDGLSEKLEIDELCSLYDELKPHVEKFMKLFHGLEKTEITIHVENVKT